MADTLEQRTIQALGAYQFQVLRLMTELDALRARVAQLEAEKKP